MASILNIENLSMIRKYPTELIIMGLISWCTYLQIQVGTINKEKENYMMEDREKMLIAITENTKVIQQNNTLFETILLNDFQQGYISQQPGNDPRKGKPANR